MAIVFVLLSTEKNDSTAPYHKGSKLRKPSFLIDECRGQLPSSVPKLSYPNVLVSKPRFKPTFGIYTEEGVERISPHIYDEIGVKCIKLGE